MARIPYRSIRRAAGFSLVELLVATSISGVLASIAYPTFTGSVHKIRRYLPFLTMSCTGPTTA